MSTYEGEHTVFVMTSIVDRAFKYAKYSKYSKNGDVAQLVECLFHMLKALEDG
jgi:hypothetical protein